MSTLKPPLALGGPRTAPVKIRSLETNKPGPVALSAAAGVSRSMVLDSSLERGAPGTKQQQCRGGVRWIAGSTALLLVASHARMLVRVNREAATGPTGGWPTLLGLQSEERRLGNASASASLSVAGGTILARHDLGHADLPTWASKPIMYLDIGPYKTGSTFLQCALARNGYEILQRDNVLYLGTCAYECLRKVNGYPSLRTYEFCLGHSGDSVFLRNHTVMDKLQQKLRALARGGRNALMVWEYFSDSHEERVRNLMEALDGWEVRVIVHYRRLYEWLPSMYSQMHRPGLNGRQQFMVWPGEIATRKSGQIVVGKIRAPFDLYSPSQQLELELSPRYKAAVQKIFADELHPTERALQLWKPYVSSITVFDMHNLTAKIAGKGDPFLVQFFCHTIPALNNSCAAAKSNEFEILDEGRNSQFYANNYDLLALHADQLGLQPNGTTRPSRPEVWAMIQHRQEVELNRTSHDFPRACLSNESLKLLLNLSVTLERSLLPGRDVEHRENFDVAVRDGKFCHIDVNQTVALPDWRHFFQPYASVAPHVLERDIRGRWTPPIVAMRSIKEVFFASRMGRPMKPRLPQLNVLGFLAIPHTGLNPIAHHLTDAGMSFSQYVKPPTSSLPSRSTLPPELGCIFGPPKAWGDSTTDRGWQKIQCLQPTYANLVYSWMKTLPQLRTTAELPAENHHQQLLRFGTPNTRSNGVRDHRLQVSMTTVVMLREPTARLISIFLADRHDWDGRVADNGFFVDIVAWLASMKQSNKRVRKSGVLRDQYRSLAGNVDRAISNISGKAQTLVLLSECYNASVQLLLERYPQVVKKKLVESILTSTGGVFATKNDKVQPIHAEIGRPDVLTPALQEISRFRDKVKQWFAEDYRLYEVAVTQFRRLLATSNIDESLVQDCLQRLG